MQTSDRAGNAATVATSVSAGEPLLDALQHLYRAYQKSSIYPPGHPAVPESLELAVRGMEEALATRETVRIAAGRDRLTVDGERLDEPTGALRSLATLLHDLDVAAVKFRPGIDRRELESFVLTLGEARRDGAKGKTLVERLAESRLQHLGITPVDYGALSFKDGAREESVAEADLWDSLGAMLTGPAADATTPADPRQLAEEVDRDIQEGTGVDVVRERVRRLGREINESEPSRRASGRAWMTKFVSALNPRLRRDLLRIDPRLPEESLALMNELADLLPEGDLFGALQQIDRAGSRLPSQMLTLMNKLMRLSDTRPAVKSGLEKTLDRWGVSREVLRQERPNLKLALQEVFHRRADTEFNPQPYQELLDDLAVSGLGGRSIPCERLYRDPRKSDDVRLHSAEVAVRLLVRKGGEQHRAAVLAHVAALIDPLLAHQRIDDVRDAVVCARAHSLGKRTHDATRRAAKALLDSFNDERRISLVLDYVRSRGELTDAARDLLQLGGVSALGLIFDALGEKLPRRAEKQLQRVAAEKKAEDLCKVLRWRSERGREALLPMFPVIRGLSPELATSMLAELLEHDDTEVRSRALLMLLVMDEPDSLERHLRRGLTDDDPEYVSLVVRSLGDLGTEGSLELLGAYIEGSLPSTEPIPGCAALAARCLVQKKEAGVVRLCKCLDALSRTLRPGRLRLALRLRDMLGDHLEVPAVRECLKRWRLSRAGLAGRLLLLPRLVRVGGAG
jgi:hypothetical protein